MIRLPFFVVPLATHFPLYVVGKLTLRLINSDEPESFAQNKIVFGLLLALLTCAFPPLDASGSRRVGADVREPIDPALFFLAWAFFYHTPAGAVASVLLVWAFVRYHNSLIDDQYWHFKQLVAHWRILLAIWLSSSSENKVRRALKLRGETARLLAGYILSLEDSRSKESVELFKTLGARIVPVLQGEESVDSEDVKMGHVPSSSK